MTVSSFDPETNNLTVFVKRMGEGETEWSGQVIATLKAGPDTRPLFSST
jgi:hypothetical protein